VREEVQETGGTVTVSIFVVCTVRVTRWAGHVARLREKRNTWRILVGKPEGKRPLERPGRGWCGDIKMDVAGISW
jgi:hypothetical protein